MAGASPRPASRAGGRTPSNAVRTQQVGGGGGVQMSRLFDALAFSKTPDGLAQAELARLLRLRPSSSTTKKELPLLVADETQLPQARVCAAPRVVGVQMADSPVEDGAGGPDLDVARADVPFEK